MRRDHDLTHIRSAVVVPILLSLLIGICAPVRLDCRGKALGIESMNQDLQSWVEKQLDRMSPEEKLGQLFFPSFSGRSSGRNSQSWRTMLAQIRDCKPGGIHINNGNLRDIAQLIQRLQKAGTVPLLITADLEGGVGFRFPGATRLPRAMAIAAGGKVDSAYQAGAITAREARALGIHINFYPVADVNNNASNPIISIRSFGEDPQKVQQLVCSYLRGLQENGMVAVVKHFPGHGDTSVDSHREIPIINAPLERLRKVELPPFQAAIQAGVLGVMAGHLYVPALEPENGLPATLSSRILTKLLRQEMGFSGLIFTDAMNMKGFAAGNTMEESTVRSFLAGSDVLLCPANLKKAYQALQEALRNGRISPDRLDRSVKRILEIKARLGLHRANATVALPVVPFRPSVSDADQARKIMEDAITLVKDEKKIIPLKLAKTKKLLHLLIPDTPKWRPKPGSVFAAGLKRKHAGTTSMEVGKLASRKTIDRVLQTSRSVDVIVASVFVRVTSGKGTVELSPLQIELLKKLAAGPKPLVVVCFGSPYLLVTIPELQEYMLTYEYYPEAEKAAVKALFGEMTPRGQLPVSLGGLHPAE